jgi:beta-xylosidase
LPHRNKKGGLVLRIQPSFALATLLAAATVSSSTASAAAPDALPLAPVLRVDFPDPFILPHDGRFFAYATNTDKGRENVQMASSTDLVSWELVKNRQNPKQLHDAMPVLPAWVKRGYTWAPEVLKTETGFVLYFTARDKKTGRQCVGAATSTDPLGPFTSSADRPLVCQEALGGTIDASPFRDADGQLYLYFKNDGNAVRKPTEIFGQRLSSDGLSLTGEPVSLLRNDKPWEAHVIEAPTMVRTPSGYTMLFSANDFAWQKHRRLSPYAVGYARCEGPLGPCTDAPENPILYSYFDPKLGCLSGPGHQTVFEANKRTYIVFHAWQTTPECRRLDWKRFVYIAPMNLKDGKPQIDISLPPAKPD